MGERPSGMVTFLFTDIEDSTAQWQANEMAMRRALAVHDAVLDETVSAAGGSLFKHTGDGVCAAFSSVPDAVDAAVKAQERLQLPVRMGLHTGEAVPRADDYFGPTLNLTARVMDAGHGGQVLLSQATASLVENTTLVELGAFQLAGFSGAERLFQVGEGQFPPLRAAPYQAGNLPAHLTTFVGRAAELEELAAVVTSYRLVSVAGVGGAGKTRLAVEVASRVAGEFPDGVWLAELASASTEDSVPNVVASALGVPSVGNQTALESVVAAFSTKRALVILDNCEHLVTATAEVIERLLADCPGLVVLTTTRRPVMIEGERLFPVAPLDQADAIRLFEDRAVAEAPDLQLDEVQRRAIAEICGRLDGLPLAVELAAGRVRALTPVEIARMLDERFRLLVGGRRSRVERHQTLRGTLDWSYELCDLAEQIVFDRLSVFAAPFDLAAAQTVCADEAISEVDVAEVTVGLVDRSLVGRVVAASGAARFALLETLRSYGRDHLAASGDSDPTRSRHAHWVRAELARNALALFGPREVEAMAAVDMLVPEARVAFDWAIEQKDWDLALSLMSWGPSGFVRRSQEHLDAGQRLVDATTDETWEQRWEVLFWFPADQLPESVGPTVAAMRDPDLHVPADRFAIPPEAYLAEALSAGIGEVDPDELASSILARKGLPAVTEISTLAHVSRSLAMYQRTDLAAPLCDRLDELVEKVDSRHGRARVEEVRGQIGRVERDPAAVGHFERALAAADELDLPHERFLWGLHLALARADTAPAEVTVDDLARPLRVARRLSFPTDMYWFATHTVAVVAPHAGQPELAARFLGWASEHSPAPFMEGLSTSDDPWPKLEAALGDRLDAELARGARTDVHALVDALFAVAEAPEAALPSRRGHVP